MPKVAESLLALSFGDIEALGVTSILAEGSEQYFYDYPNWTLRDLLVERFPDTAHPTLRFEVQRQIDRCDGDPLKLLRDVSRGVDGAPASSWNDRFPMDVFSRPIRGSHKIAFDIADAHLHSGASVPLPLFFNGLASVRELKPRELENRKMRTARGGEWDVYILLASTRWALRLLRYLRARRSLADRISLAERGFNPSLLNQVEQGTFWREVKLAARGEVAKAELLTKLTRKFDDDGLCSVDEVFWGVAESEECEFVGKTHFLVGLVRAFVAISSIISARPGDGLSRFADRFTEMGMTRDTALGEIKTKLVRSTLERIAPSDQVVGAEFRKTIISATPEGFKNDVRAALCDHYRGFVGFVESCGREMALSMPVGFQRRRWSGAAGEWTDMRQLSEAMHGYEGLRELSLEDDGTLISAVSLFDVAGDEFGSASWPYLIVAELLRRSGVELGFAIHAGESFYSELNGVRRVGELFLGERCPDRIGHALALSRPASAAISKGSTSPPLRVGDALCDLAWSIVAKCGDSDRACELIYELARGTGGSAFGPAVWIEAYQCLFSVEKLMERGILTTTGDKIGVLPEQDLRIRAQAGSSLDRAVAALGWGAGSDIAHAEVKSLVPPALLAEIQAFGVTTAESARESVRKLVSKHRTVIESCPTSNVRLAKLAGYGDHPLWNWHQEGLRVVVGSDDPLIFGATICDEFDELLDAGEEDQVKAIARETITCCSGGNPRRLQDLRRVVQLTS
jgi:Adenosine deaminase